MLGSATQVPRITPGFPVAAAEVAQISLKDSVRVATVDNFQGEESTIVILSLVRNNK